LNQQATWRDRKAADHPQDLRNAGSAQALRAAADHVMGLEPTDPRLQSLVSMPWVSGLVEEDGLLLPGEEGSREASTCGFHAPVDPDVWLDAFVAACGRDAADYFAAAGPEEVVPFRS
jgi:hypothetical protein